MDQPLPGGAAPLGPQDPRTIGAHTVLGKLGQGGMGAVYLGRGPRGMVAIKVIRDELGADPGFRARFGQEVAAGQRVASFCTAAMLDHGVDGGRPYLVTEFIDGPTLHEHVLRHGALTEGTLQGFAVGVAAALTAIHGAGLVHRDLKPSNVILSVSGPRVIDFGIARALDATTGVTRTGQLIGSPGWIAPEQLLADRLTTAVDIYTWGCLVAFAARAQHPFGGGAPIAMASRVLHGEPDLEGVPDPLLGHVRAALVKDPALRPTAQQLLLALVGGGAPQTLNAQATRVVEESWHGSPIPAGLRPQPTAPTEHVPPPPAPRPDGAPGTRPAGAPPGPYGGAPGGHGLPPAPDVRGGPTQPHGGHGPHEPHGPTHNPSGGPYAAAPQAPTTPRPLRSGPAVRRPLVLAGGGVLVAAVVAAGVLLALNERDESLGGGGGTANALDKDGYTLAPLSPDTGVGQARDDAGVRLTVGQPRCGGTSYGDMEAAGRFCLVSLTVHNPSLTEKSERIPLRRHVLVKADGGQIMNTEYTDGFLNNTPSLPPGDRLSGMLLFDVPDGTVLKSVRVYGANDSEGVEVPL